MIIVQSQIFLENLTAITLCNLQQSQLQWRQNYTDSDGIGGGVGGHAKYLVLLQNRATKHGNSKKQLW